MLSTRQVIVSVAKVVNPQGTVTTLTASKERAEPTQLVADQYLHENCDESLFRPVVTVLTDAKELVAARNAEKIEGKRPTNVSTQLIVPVIDENLEKIKQKEKQQKIVEHPKKDSKAREVAAELIETKVEDFKPVVIAEPTKKSRKLSKNEMKYNKKDKYAKEPSPPIATTSLVSQPALVGESKIEIAETVIEPIKISAEKQRKSPSIEKETLLTKLEAIPLPIFEKVQEKSKKEKLKKTPSIEKKLPEPEAVDKSPEPEIIERAPQNSEKFNKKSKKDFKKGDTPESTNDKKISESVEEPSKAHDNFREISPEISIEKDVWDDASFEEIVEQTPAFAIEPFENDEIEIVEIYEDPPTIPDILPTQIIKSSIAQLTKKAKSEEKDMKIAKLDELPKAKSVEAPELRNRKKSIESLKNVEPVTAPIKIETPPVPIVEDQKEIQEAKKEVVKESNSSWKKKEKKNKQKAEEILIQEPKVRELSPVLTTPTPFAPEIQDKAVVDIKTPTKAQKVKSLEQEFEELKELQQKLGLERISKYIEQEVTLPKTPPPEEQNAVTKSKADNPKTKKGLKTKFSKLTELQPLTPPKEQTVNDTPVPDPEDEVLTMEFPALAPLEDVPLLDDHQNADENVIMKISMHQSIGDDDIEIVPHKNILSIQEPTKEPTKKAKGKKNGKKMEIKSEDFYDMQINLDDLPPLEPLAVFEALTYDKPDYDHKKNDGNNNQNNEATENACLINLESPEADDQKEQIQKKLSELLNDTNMIFAMCSSLKEMSVDSTSQILTSTSSSTTNTTTTTFATDSASSTQLEPLDCDYKSLDLEMEENFMSSNEEKVSTPEEASSASSDESSKNQPNVADDEELRPLLTSITLLNSLSPLSQTPEIAEPVIPLPENQKQSTSAASSTNVGNKKKFNKKKKR